MALPIACDFERNSLYEKAEDSMEMGNEFSSILPADIESETLSNASIDGSVDNNQLPEGTIVVYQTSEGRYGKLQVMEYGYDLTIRWLTYDFDESIYSSGEGLKIHGTWFCDLDVGVEEGITPTNDFFWEQVTGTERYLSPRNGAAFSLY